MIEISNYMHNMDDILKSEYQNMEEILNMIKSIVIYLQQELVMKFIDLIYIKVNFYKVLKQSLKALMP